MASLHNEVSHQTESESDARLTRLPSRLMQGIALTSGTKSAILSAEPRGVSRLVRAKFTTEEFLMNAYTRAGLKRISWWAIARSWPIGLALFFAISHALVGQEPGGETTAYRVVEARAGETCIVCDKAIGAKDRVYEVEGQRVPVHVGVCGEAFLRNPGLYLARLRPRGAFLGAEPNLASRIGWGWFALGIYVLLGLVFGAICAYRAVNHALKPWPWFLAGFSLNLFGFLALVTRPAGDSSRAGLPPGLVKVPTTYSPRACPACGKMNHPSATSCAGCGNKIEPLVTSEVARAGLRGASGSAASG